MPTPRKSPTVRAKQTIASCVLPPPPFTMLSSRPPFGAHMPPAHPEGDAAIRQTDTDAAMARWSAVQRGYFTDPFIKPLLPRGAHLQPTRPPLINVGTYVRSEGIDKLVDEWFQLSAREGKQCQIVSFGAGSDTRFWRIAVRVSSMNATAGPQLSW